MPTLSRGPVFPGFLYLYLCLHLYQICGIMSKFLYKEVLLTMTDITSYPYQEECLERLEETRHQGISRALVVMATGLGKTVVAAFDAKKCVEQKSWRVLYLAHQNQILEQARDTFRKVLGEQAIFGFFTGEEKTLEEVTCLFASFQTMQNWREGFYKDEFDYIIVDESHHGHAETYLPTLKYFKPKFTLAITATPDRRDLRDIRHLFGSEIFSISLEEALAKGYLTNVDYRLLIDELQAKKAIETPAGELSIRELNRRLFIPMRDETIVETIREKVVDIESPRIIVFCSSIRHCENIAALMPKAAALHSKIHFRDQRDRLKAFRQGELETLVTVDKFNEGIDIPTANVIVFLRSTSSRTVFLQQLGRGLRHAEDKSSVLVLDFVANCERIERVAKLAHDVQKVRDEFGLDQQPEGGKDSADSFVLEHAGEFHFTELVRNVLEIIGEVRSTFDFSRGGLIEELQKLGRLLGKTPTSVDVKDSQNSPSLSTFTKKFGTFNAALRAAGFGVTKEGSYTKAELITYLQRRAKELGRPPTEPEIHKWSADRKGPSTGPFRRLFGSMSKAIDAAQIAPEQATKQKMLEDLRALADDLGRTPMRDDLVQAAQEGKISSHKRYVREFGSYTVAVTNAGLIPNRNPGVRSTRYTQESVLESYCTISDEHGYPAGYRELTEAKKAEPDSYPGFGQYTKYFGSIEALKKEYSNRKGARKRK